MRVAFVNQTGAKPGGAEESLTLLLRNLPPDIEPLVVMFEDGEFAERLRGYGFATSVVAVPESIRSVTRERPASFGASALPGIILELARLLGQRRVDLVHTNTMKAHLLASPAARLAGLPSIMHVRDMVEGIGRTALRSVALTCTRERIAISNATPKVRCVQHA